MAMALVPPNPSLAIRFMALFQGSETASGTHGVPERDPDGLKWSIKRTAKSMREPITLEMWQQHIDGKRPLGVIPIREDCTCSWGSIDYDEYDVDLSELLDKVERSELPLIPCRSKSGGLHLFLFLQQPEPAALVQAALRDAAASLGVAACEIFPKQTRIAVERNDMGNWMVMPYFGGDYGGKLKWQRGLKFRTGAEMTANEFLVIADKSKTKIDVFAAACEKRRAATSGSGEPPGHTQKGDKSRRDFSNGPCCLQHMAAQGFPSDGRKRAIFMIAVYLKRADPVGWKDKLETENQVLFNPPLPSAEVSSVIKSVDKKQYEYICKEEPMRSHCNASLCRGRKFGVGTGGEGEMEMPTLSNMRVQLSENPTWFVNVADRNGQDIVLELETEDLQLFARFQKVAMDKTKRMFPPVKQTTWCAIVDEAMKDVTELPISPDIAPGGHFAELLEEYLTNTAQGDRREDLLRNVPWADEINGKRFFTTWGFQAFLKRQGYRDLSHIRIARRVANMGGGHEQQWFGPKDGRPKQKGKSSYWVPFDAVAETPQLPVPDKSKLEQKI